MLLPLKVSQSWPGTVMLAVTALIFVVIPFKLHFQTLLRIWRWIQHTTSANARHIQTSIRPLLSMCTMVTIVWSLPAASWALAIIVCSARPSMTCSVSAWTADQQPASASVCIPVLCILQLAFVLVQLAAECSMTSCNMIKLTNTYLTYA